MAEAGKLATPEKTALGRMGLEALIEREAARRLARMGGAMPRLNSHRADAPLRAGQGFSRYVGLGGTFPARLPMAEISHRRSGFTACDW